MYYEGDGFELEKKEVETEKEIKIRETVAEISSKAKEGIEKKNRVTDKLKDDSRINFAHMEYLPTFLDNMEYGVETNQSIVKSQILSFSDGNEDVMNEYANDQEFMSNIEDAIKLRSEVYKEIRELSNLFSDAGYSTSETTTDYILYKAEFGLYDPSNRESFENIFADDFADLITKTEHDMLQGESAYDHYLEDLMYEDKFKERFNAEISDGLEYYREVLEERHSMSEERFEKLFERQRKILFEKFDMYDFQTDSKDFKPIGYKINAGAYPSDKTEFYKEITKDLAPFIPTKEQKEEGELQWELNSMLKRTTIESAEGDLFDLRMQVQTNVDKALDQIQSMENPESIHKNRSFQIVYSGLRNGDFTGRTEIEKTLEAVKAPKIEEELFEHLVAINRTSFFLKETSNHVKNLKKEQLEKNFSEAKNEYKNREFDLVTKMDALKDKIEELKKENEQLKQEQERKPRRSFFSLER